jgi:bifunctional DNase/RNase
MEKIRLTILTLNLSQTQSGAYALILGEESGYRRLPIIIGGYEAQAIAVEMENMTPRRPLTHDLFKNFALSFKIDITEVVIYKLIEGVFFSKLICTNGETTVEIDARTSDAIAMAVRFNCPIYTFEDILSQAGVTTDEDSGPYSEQQSEASPARKKEAAPNQEEYSSMSEEELQESLIKAIDDEAYETASKIRDELNKRKKA